FKRFCLPRIAKETTDEGFGRFCICIRTWSERWYGPFACKFANVCGIEKEAFADRCSGSEIATTVGGGAQACNVEHLRRKRRNTTRCKRDRCGDHLVS